MPRCPAARRSLGWRFGAFAIVLLPLTLVGCNAAGLPPPSGGVGHLPGTPAAGLQAAVSDEPCAAGRITLGHLDEADASLAAALAETKAEARAWQPDARLIALRLGCPLMEPGFRWGATFYSAGERALLRTDTGQVEPAAAPAAALPAEQLSFATLQRSLIKAGYADDTKFLPGSGVEVRQSTEAVPFGPPEAPRNEIYYHVAIEDGGDVLDLFVAAADGTIYRYRS